MDMNTLRNLPTLPEIPRRGYWFAGFGTTWPSSREVMCFVNRPNLVKVFVESYPPPYQWVILAPMTAGEMSTVYS